MIKRVMYVVGWRFHPVALYYLHLFAVNVENVFLIDCLLSGTVSGRTENHRWRSVPVGEEACRCDDPHRLLLERLRPHRIATVHGPAEA